MTNTPQGPTKDTIVLKRRNKISWEQFNRYYSQLNPRDKAWVDERMSGAKESKPNPNFQEWSGL